MDRGNVIALGFFDGVHLGHAALLRTTVEIAAISGLTPVAATFDRHPASAVSGLDIPLINSNSDRKHLIKSLFGIENIITFVFDDKFKNTDYHDFIAALLTRYRAAHLVAGFDYRFGRGGNGNAELLREHAATSGIGCNIVDAVSVDGLTVSSTHIRGLITNGETVKAERFLGHPHILSGVVSEGRKLGRTLGFPTVNISVPDGVQPPRFGVYATKIHLGDTVYDGVSNVGKKPTVSQNEAVGVETHIFNFDRQTYGEKIIVEFGRFVRPEMKFPGLDALKAQVDADRETVWKELSSQD